MLGFWGSERQGLARKDQRARAGQHHHAAQQFDLPVAGMGADGLRRQGKGSGHAGTMRRRPFPKGKDLPIDLGCATYITW